MRHVGGNWNADTEGSDDALGHDKERRPHPVVEADEAEEEAGEQAVDGISLEIICCLCDDRSVAREDTAQKISMEESKVSHGNPEGDRKADTI